MRLPDLADYTETQYAKAAQEKSIIQFKGYNVNPVIFDGEMREMTNLSGLEYPCLSPRKSRAVIVEDASAYEAFGAKDTVKVHVAGDTFYYDGVSKGALGSYGARQLVPFQDRVLIWPDKMFYDVTDDELGNLENTNTQMGLEFTTSTINGTFSGLATGDAVEISGCTENEDNNKTAIITEASETELTFADNTFTAGTETASVTIKRAVPDMDYICVANNRVWGCKSNTIYGSKLGDATNWNYFPGLSTDSYSLDVASDGDFTGCCAFSSYVVFFKENYIHKLLGTKPSNFQTTTIIARGMGLEAGSAKSLSIVSEVLYYKAQAGIVAFTGGVPELVSRCFGNDSYSSGVAANDGRRYFVSLFDGSVWHLFVFDTFTGLWHREDATQVVDFAVIGGTVYYLGGGKVYQMESGTEIVAWSATLGEFTEFAAEKKGFSKLQLRAELPQDSTLKVEYNPDEKGWITAYEGSGAYRKAFYIPIIPTRCDSFVIRLSGTGACRLYQMNRIFKYGSDVG